jgi:hypothetical protein
MVVVLHIDDILTQEMVIKIIVWLYIVFLYFLSNVGSN